MTRYPDDQWTGEGEEYGIFNDEGLIEGGYSSQEDAEFDMNQEFDAEDNHPWLRVHVEKVCPDHPEQPKFGCKECSVDTVGEENMTETKQTSGFSCMECGYKFKTLKAAERASFGPNGCPKCGGADIGETDIGLPVHYAEKTGLDSISGENNPFFKKNEAAHPAWPSMIEPDERLESNVSMNDIRTIVNAVKKGASKERFATSPAGRRLGVTVEDIDGFMKMDERGLLECKKLRESKEPQTTDEFDKYMDDILTREALARKRQQEQQQAPETANRTYNKRYSELPQNSIRYGVKK
jgi:hypothetical protein